MNEHHNEATQPTTEELKRWAKAPMHPQQPLITENEFTPEEAKQPRPLSGNPVIKVALVAGMMLPIFTVAGLLLNGNRPSPPQKTATQSTNSESTNASVNSDAAIVAKQREELGQTQAELAIANQTQALKHQPALKQPPTLQNQPATKLAPAVRPVVSSVPAEPVSYTRSTRIIQPPTYSIAPPVVQPPITSQSLGLGTPSSYPLGTPPQENNDRYLALTQLGSYGQLSPEASRNQTEQSQSFSQPASPQLADSTLVSWQPVVPQIRPEEEAPILAEQSQRSLLVSTKAEGILTTPIAVDQRKPQDDKFTIQLVQPIKAEDGSIALPSGTPLIAQVNSIGETGLIQLQVMSVVVNQNGQQSEITLPPDAIRVRGKAGQPLIAENYGDKGKEIASMDIGLFALGALSKASELFTRPESSSIVSNDGGVVTSTRNPKPNVLAGILQGGSQALLDAISQRNQRAIQAIAQQPNLRFLPAGSVVEVYVNRSLTLPVDLLTASIPSAQSESSEVLDPVEPSANHPQVMPERIQDTEVLQNSVSSSPFPENTMTHPALLID